MATPEDLQANADYIRMADQYVEVSGNSLLMHRPALLALELDLRKEQRDMV